MAFKVYNAREEATKASRKARLKQKAELQANLLERHTQALVAALRLATGQRCVPRSHHQEPASNAVMRATGPANAQTPGSQQSPALVTNIRDIGRVIVSGRLRPRPYRAEVWAPKRPFPPRTPPWNFSPLVKIDGAQTRGPP